MRARFNKNAQTEIENFDRYIASAEELQEIIKNNKDKKIYLEVGMGKGDFITGMSLLDKENIYIGVELCIPVLCLAIKKLNRYETEHNIKIDNLYFMSFDAIKLSEYFKTNQVEKLFLNFSDPWPKKKHTKRRLTYHAFLEQFKNVLRKNGIIEFKTDNRGLFEYSLVSMQNFGMTFLEVYLDLHKTDIFNVETEYEKKFSPNGPIYKLVAKF